MLKASMTAWGSSMSDIKKAKKLYKEWHQYGHSDIIDVDIPVPKGKLKNLGKIIRTDYTSPKWNGKEITYYYHYNQKNQPYLLEDNKGNLFYSGLINITPLGIDDIETDYKLADWETASTVDYPRKPPKAVTKLGVLELISYVDEDGKTQTLTFGDRYFVGHPDKDWCYITSPMKIPVQNPSIRQRIHNLLRHHGLPLDAIIKGHPQYKQAKDLLMSEKLWDFIHAVDSAIAISSRSENPEHMSIWDAYKALQNGKEVKNATINGVVLDVKTRYGGLLLLCPVDKNEVLDYKFQCIIHGQQTNMAIDIGTHIVIDDGTAAALVILNRTQTLKMLGTTMQDILNNVASFKRRENLILYQTKIRDKLIEVMIAHKYTITGDAYIDDTPALKFKATSIEPYIDTELAQVQQRAKEDTVKFMQELKKAQDEPPKITTPFTTKESWKSKKLTIAHIPAMVKKIMPKHQQKVIVGSEEHWETMSHLEQQAKGVPKLYAQEKLGHNAIVHLHYFYGTSDWYITEWDGKDEFFGFTILAQDYQNSEFGYIPRTELIEQGMIELDFHWKPKPLQEALEAVDPYFKEEAEPDVVPKPKYESESGYWDVVPKYLGFVVPKEIPIGTLPAVFPRLNKRGTLGAYKEEVMKGPKENYIQNVKIVETRKMGQEEWDDFTFSLLKDRDWLAGKGGSQSDTGPDKPRGEWNEADMTQALKGMYQKVIAVISPTGETIYVDPQGNDYARYVGFPLPITIQNPKKNANPTKEQFIAEANEKITVLNKQEAKHYFDTYGVSMDPWMEAYKSKMYTPTAEHLLFTLFGIPKAQTRRMLQEHRARSETRGMKVGYAGGSTFGGGTTTTKKYLFDRNTVLEIAYDYLHAEANPTFIPQPKADITKGLTVLSYGAGQDSTAILFKLWKDPEWRKKYVGDGHLLVIMSDTGNEHPETYKHVEFTKHFCRHEGIEFYFITKYMGYHSHSWQSLIEKYKSNTTIGSHTYPKSCTVQLKIDVLYKFLNTYVGTALGPSLETRNEAIKQISELKAQKKAIQSIRDSASTKKRKEINAQIEALRPLTMDPMEDKRALKDYAKKYGKIKVLIGFAKGEETRISGDEAYPPWMGQSIKRMFPLVDNGYDRAACVAYIRSLGYEAPPPSNCMICPYMNKLELLWLYRNYPDMYNMWVELEQNKLNKWKHLGKLNYGVWKNKTLPQVLQETIDQNPNITVQELNEYKWTHGHSNMSKY